MEIHDCEQRDERWFELRRGRATASMFSAVCAKGRGGGESKTRQTYMCKLAGERISGEPMENYVNAHIERGREMEAGARAAYSFLRDAEPEQVGFVTNAAAGASPDALLGDDGLLEIKTALPHLMVEYLVNDVFPPSHLPQTQGQLWVSERKWLDLVIFWPTMPLFVKRIERDEEYIAKLTAEVTKFNAELDELVKKVEAFR